jgi:hypothetical protein
MGADLILAMLVQPADVVLNAESAHEAVDAMGDDQIEQVAEGNCLDHDEVKLRLHEALDYLFAPQGHRDLTMIDVPGYQLLVSGGMSWGDDPTEGFGHLSRLAWAPDVLLAAGFEPEWPEPPPKPPPFDVFHSGWLPWTREIAQATGYDGGPDDYGVGAVFNAALALGFQIIPPRERPDAPAQT